MDIGNLLTGATPGMLDLALLIGRGAIGICFVVHALGKLGLVGSGNMPGFQAWLEELGVPFPAINARMAMLSELTGGTLLAIGLFTRPAAAILIGTMAVAAVVGHKGAGYLITNDPPGAEYPINLSVVCLMFILMGPGTISLDAILF